MKVVILAGGLGTRLSEETEIRPKPMVEIGGRPILWHIMKYFAHHGHNEFYILLGHKGDHIKRFFLEYSDLAGSLTVDLKQGRVDRHARDSEDWKVHLVDTGARTSTGGRIKRIEAMLGGEPFLATYGDGVTDLDLPKLLAFHKARGLAATITAVRPPARFGGLVFQGDKVTSFSEKPQISEGWINGGFMVLEPQVLKYLAGDESVLEVDGLERLAADGQLAAFRHEGFWQCMDTLRDVRLLESLWQGGRPPWKVWA